MTILGYISTVIGICAFLLGLAFGITWVDLHNQIKNSPELRAYFSKAFSWLGRSIFIAIVNFSGTLFSTGRVGVRTEWDTLVVFASAFLFIGGMIMFLGCLIILILEAKHEAEKRQTK